MLSRLLLLPLLSPLLAVLLVAAINPTPVVSLRLLSWRSPPLPMGLWMAMASLGGAAISGSAGLLTLRQIAGPARRRVTVRPFQGDAERQPRRPADSWTDQDRREGVDPGSGRPPPRHTPWGGDVGPVRPPGEPPPTVTVPFRIIRTPVGEQVPIGSVSSPPEASRATSPVRDPSLNNDDWSSVESDEW